MFVVIQNNVQVVQIILLHIVLNRTNLFRSFFVSVTDILDPAASTVAVSEAHQRQIRFSS